MKRSETAIPKLRTNSDGSKTWWYEWRQDGQHRSLVVGDGSRSRTWATRELRTLFSRLEKAEAERAVSGFSSRSTVREMAARWLDASESGWAKNTAAAMRSAVRAHILPAIGDKPVGDVRAFDVQAIYVRLVSAKRARNTAIVIRAAIRGLWTWMAENDLDVRLVSLARLPKTLRRTAETRPLDADEIAQVMRAKGSAGTALRCMLLCGMRPGEALALRANDFDAAARRVRVDEALQRQGGYGPTKTNRIRYVPVPRGLAAELAGLAEGKAGAELLFQPPAGSWSVSRLRETVQAELGSEITLRRLRTTYATEFEGDLADAQATLGHTQIKTTMAHYRKAKEERAAASADALESKLSKPESKRTSGHIENKRVG